MSEEQNVEAMRQILQSEQQAERYVQEFKNAVLETILTVILGNAKLKEAVGKCPLPQVTAKHTQGHHLRCLREDICEIPHPLNVILPCACPRAC